MPQTSVEASSQTPQQTLEALKQKLSETQAQLESLTSENDQLTRDINDLESQLSETDQVVESYGSAVDELSKSKSHLDEYYRTKVKMVEAALSESQRQQIDETITAYDEPLENVRSTIEELTQELTKAEHDVQEAEQHHESRKKAFIEYKEFEQILNDKLEGLKSLREKIEELDAEGKTTQMYFLLKEFAKILAEAEVREPEWLKQRLNQAWVELSASSQALREATEDLRSTKSRLTAEQAELDTLTKQRRSSILEEIADQTAQPADTGEEVTSSGTSEEGGGSAAGGSGPATPVTGTEGPQQGPQ